MNNVFNRDIEKWVRPWNEEKFDDLYNRDERFFSLVIKGLLSWLNRNIVLYNKGINHFVFNTGSSYLYIESNGYEYSVTETTGEDTMYMKLPRCLIELTDISIPTEELSSPYSRGNYERKTGNMICGYNSEIRRLPLELTINAKYYLSNFNESIILLQELIDKLVFQKYYKISYLGQEIQCSIEFPGNANPELNKIDMTSPEPTQRNITLDLRICTNYPIINERAEIPTDKVIAVFGSNVVIHDDIDDVNHNINYQESERDRKSDPTVTDVDRRGGPLSDQTDGYEALNGKEDKGLELITNSDHSQEVIDHDEENILRKLDLDKDGNFNGDDVIKLLENIKYEHYSEDLDLNNDLEVDYYDLIKLMNLVNARKDVHIEYDKYMKKLYMEHVNEGTFEEIDLSKYKIE